MPIDKLQIESRLEKLQTYYQRLRQYRQESAGKLDDQKLIDAVERNLQLAIEAVIDVSEILIANLKLKKPESNKQALEILAAEKILPQVLGKRLALAAGFRNILINEYLDIDITKVNQYLQKDINDFDAFARAIAKFTKTHKD